MNIEKITTVKVTDENGAEITEGKEVMFLFNDRTHIATFMGLDDRSRVVMRDKITGEDYACLASSLTHVTLV